MRKTTKRRMIKWRMNRGVIRVLLVDDHPSVLEGVRAYLTTKKHIKVIGQTRNGVQTIEAAKTLAPDVVLLDLSLPDINGFQLLKLMRDEIPTSKIIAYTMHDEEEFVRGALRAGVNGYVLKSSPLNELVRAIEKVHEGRTSFDSKISRFLSSLPTVKKAALPKIERVSISSQAYYGLTTREREILASLVEGLTIKEISNQQCSSYHTVVSHMRHIYEKIGVHKRSIAMVKALREHIV
jgi:DNA-binding NarL/FixJ family response regulator